MESKGIILIISGPSGVGKGTIVKELEHLPAYYKSVSVTTRSPRAGEQEGEHYFFRTKEQFQTMIEDDNFLEYATFCENCYGTPKDNVLNKLEENINVILEIEVQGALDVKKRYPDAVTIFVLPPSLLELQNRLLGRGSETEDVIQRRLTRALEEIDIAPQYDYLVVNDDLCEAVSDIQNIVYCEKNLKTRNNGNILQSFHI